MVSPELRQPRSSNNHLRQSLPGIAMLTITPHRGDYWCQFFFRRKKN